MMNENTTPSGPFARYRAVSEDQPADEWLGRFHAFWPAYQRWWRSREASPVSLATAERQLARHMPELMPTYRRLVDLVDGDREAARFLTLYQPPPFVVACSQAVWRGGGRSGLVRNYDLGPDLFEALVTRTRWSGRSVVGSSECLWGLDDGVNEDGLAVSLTFGGSRVTGDGFGIPLVLRYLLETCGTVEEAVPTLCRIPVHMAYNVTLVDRSGDHRTVVLHPRRAPRVTARRCATNHQDPVEWPEHAAATRSVERERLLEALVAEPGLELAELTEAFLDEGLYHRDWDRAFGTLYTVAYDCQSASARYRWPGTTMELSCERFSPGCWTIEYRPAELRQPAAPRRRARRRPSVRWPSEVLEALRGGAALPPEVLARVERTLREVAAGSAPDWSRVASIWSEACPGSAGGASPVASGGRARRPAA